MIESESSAPGKYILSIGFSNENIKEVRDPFGMSPYEQQKVEIRTEGFLIIAPQDKLKDYVKTASFRPSDLAETVELMNSADYKDRFRAEYLQDKIRYEKLKTMVDKWDAGKLEFTPTCPREIYNFQLKAMKEKLDVLVIRAKIEGIEGL